VSILDVLSGDLLSLLSRPRAPLFNTIAMSPKSEAAVHEAFQDTHQFGLGALRIVQSPYIEPVCAVQVDPKFPWISDEGRKRINARFEAMFGKTQDVAYMFDAKAMRDFMCGWRDDIDKQCVKLMMGES
jgi:hypothetical protein